ncbi:MAG TPA: hypothetical protein VI300_31485, partial [Solirubrobacter sp.]
MTRLRQPAVLLLSAAVSGLGVIALIEAHLHPSESVGGGGAAALVLQLVAGLALWGGGLHLALHRSNAASGALLAAAGPALFLGQLPQPESGGSLLFTAALVGGGLVTTLAGAAAVLQARPRRRVDSLFAAAALATAALFALL